MTTTPFFHPILPLLIDKKLAREAGVTPRQLERLFAASLPESPMRYYLALRLDRAQALLQQTSLPVVEVAMASGFVSVSHFLRHAV